MKAAAGAVVVLLVLVGCGARVAPLESGQQGLGPQAGGAPVGRATGGQGGPVAQGTATGVGTTGPGTGRAGAQASCRSGGATDTGVSASEIRIGLVAAKTGPLPGQFDSEIEAVDAYFKMVNAEGGICGRAIKLFIRDDAANAANNERAARELAEEAKVFAFVGSISAPDSDTGIAKVSKQHKIPDIGFPLTYERTDSPYTYGVPGQIRANTIGDNAVGSAWLNEHFGVKQMAIFWLGESLFSKAEAWAFEATQLRASNGQIKVCYERETSVFDNNFDSYAIGLKGACPASDGPLAVYSTMENASNMKLAGAIEQQDVPHAYYSPTLTSYLRSFLRDEQGRPRTATEGAYLAVPQIPFERCAGPDAKGRPVPPCSHPALDRYVRALGRYVPGYHPPGSFGAAGWGMADLFVTAARGCGAALTRACLFRQLDAMKHFTADGLIAPMVPREHETYTGEILLQVRNGSFVEVRPPGKKGPSFAPEFWTYSPLYNWWDYFCAHKNLFPSRQDIDQFVTTC